VIGGAGSFVPLIDDFNGFDAATIRKLVREMAAATAPGAFLARTTRLR
jgi:hypothetical protein